MTDFEVLKRKLRWRCRRGMLELDLILLKFFDNYFDDLTLSDQKLFAQLLEEEDVMLYAWLMSQATPIELGFRNLIIKISARVTDFSIHGKINSHNNNAT